VKILQKVLGGYFFLTHTVYAAVLSLRSQLKSTHTQVQHAVKPLQQQQQQM